MQTTKHDTVRQLLDGSVAAPVAPSATAWASANIALCKYWGKRDEELNLPMNSSLSLPLGPLGTETTISPLADGDVVVADGREMDPDGEFAGRIGGFLDLFRPGREQGFEVVTRNLVPTAAGLASSASGFAALVLALDRLFGWGLPPSSLSILARLGSGSACRSTAPGLMLWDRGERSDGLDSYARELPAAWPELRLGVVSVCTAAKPVGSRLAMRRTRESSALYQAWPAKAEAELGRMKAAIASRDFEALGEAVESNALGMHATMLDAQPPICYWLPGSVEAMRQVWQARADGVRVYFTMDAGPNVKLLFETGLEAELEELFPSLTIIDPGECR